MTREQTRFAETMRVELIKAYIAEYGFESWQGKSEEEKSATLHELLGSFLTVAKRRAQGRA